MFTMRAVLVGLTVAIWCATLQARIEIVVVDRLDLTGGSPLPPLPAPDVVTAGHLSWAGRGGSSPQSNHRSVWQFRGFRIPEEAWALVYNADVFTSEPDFGGTVVSVIQDGSLVSSTIVNETVEVQNFHDVTFLAGDLVDLEFRFGAPFFFGPEDIQATLSNVHFIGPGMVGDFNDSGDVEQADLDLLLLNWGTTSNPVPADWVNDLPDGIIDQDELDRVLLYWGSASAAVPSDVPEPSSGFIAALGIVGWLVSRTGAKCVPRRS
jgi:hypothetical protein